LTEQDKERRVRYARDYRRFDWSQCVFWDETEFELHSTPNTKNDITWDEHGKAVYYEKEAHPKTFKFGAAITVNGPTRIVPYTGTIDSNEYQRMVGEAMPDIKRLMKGKAWTYVHDGARPHTSTASTQWLADKVPSSIPKKDWPANSPDLNPIENVFGYLEDQISPQKCPTVTALEKSVRKAWVNLTPEYCRKCIETIPSRLKQIIATKGEYVYEVKKTK
jgi:inhibitor of nuclear factor kappa-B kinase subunit alpha